jgi:hypothetical protein
MNDIYRAAAWLRVDQILNNIDLALLSETYLKLHERFFIPNYLFYRTDHFPVRKGGSAVAVAVFQEYSSCRHVIVEI